MRTLYLLPSERTAFDSLKDSLRDGWDIEEETFSYDDTPEKQAMRLALLRVHDPKLLALRDRVQAAASIEESTALLQQQDLKDVDEDDLAQLFFALGPVAMTRLIDGMLRHAENDEDIEGMTALTVIRHEILASLQPPSSPAA